MAHYAYKRVRDVLPNDVMTTEYFRKMVCNCDNFCKFPCDYEGDADYDGDMWTVTAEYIKRLQIAAENVLNNPENEDAKIKLAAALNGIIV